MRKCYFAQSFSRTFLFGMSKLFFGVSSHISRISSGFEFIASRPGILGQLPVQFSISPPRIIGQLTGVMVLIKAISFFTSSIKVKSAKDIPMREKLLTSSSFSISLTEGLTNSRGLHPRFLNILCAIKLPKVCVSFGGLIRNIFGTF